MNAFKIYHGISGPQISYWLAFGWSVIGAFSLWLVGRCSEVGWSVGRWSVVGGQLVSGFKKTHASLWVSLSANNFDVL